jgi:hypothetical protein
MRAIATWTGIALVFGVLVEYWLETSNFDPSLVGNDPRGIGWAAFRLLRSLPLFALIDAGALAIGRSALKKYLKGQSSLGAVVRILVLFGYAVIVINVSFTAVIFSFSDTPYFENILETTLGALAWPVLAAIELGSGNAGQAIILFGLALISSSSLVGLGIVVVTGALIARSSAVFPLLGSIIGNWRVNDALPFLHRSPAH